MDFVDTTHDIMRGISTIMDILLYQDQHDGDENAAHNIISGNSREALTRFVGTSADLLAVEAGRLIDWAYEYHTPEGQAERARVARRAVE